MACILLFPGPQAKPNREVVPLISVILYGRNDSYGYNLHKRAALSLNNIAELLSDADDEILFVDYNTPDDFPTFPEAIADTLTDKARARLRVLRVRPAQHARFRGQTHLAALEPIARNVAVRRANPANRWVLSTNTDMIFVPHGDADLTETIRPLRDGYYHLPRFEIPETLWESLDRGDPVGTIATVRAWGADFHLNEIVAADNDFFGFDGPGDFQLVLREDLHRMHGFDERMLLGWHVDANIARRLALIHGRTGALDDQLGGYHCDHTRQVTPAHRPGSVANDWRGFVEDVRDATAAGQSNWGLADAVIEEIRPDKGAAIYVGALRQAIGAPMTTPSHLLHGRVSRDRIDYDARHVVPFLVDALVAYPRDLRLGWFGARRDLLERFAVAWAALGFTAPIMVARGADWLGPDLPDKTIWADTIGTEAGAFVFDFGMPMDRAPGSRTPLDQEPALRFVADGLRAMAAAEDAHLTQSMAAQRRFIGVNAVLNQWESLMGSVVGAASAPLATRLRQGLRNPPVGLPADILARLKPGNASRRTVDGVEIIPGRRGQVLHGPPMLLAPGAYRLRLAWRGWLPGVLQATVYAWPARLVRRYPVLARDIVLDFNIPVGTGVPQSLELRLTSIGVAAGVITSAWLEHRKL